MKKNLFFIALFSFVFVYFSCNKKNIQDEPIACKINIDSLDFTFQIDYQNPEQYLLPGEQSDLSEQYFDEVRIGLGDTLSDMEGVLLICHWINQNFTFENAGGAMIGVNSVDELFQAKAFYGCHSLSLLISSVLRQYGYPAIMIETAGIDWAYQFQAGAIEYFSGHVMTEVYVNDKWILLDNNCRYLVDYDPLNPFIPLRNQIEATGYFVFAKGTDIWQYTDRNTAFTSENLIFFSENVQCFEPLFYTAQYNWQ